MNWKKYLITIVLTAMVTVSLAMAGFMAIFGFDLKQVAGVARLIGVMQFVERKYVNDVDTDTIINGAISGMVGSLGDPHSLYMDVEKYEKLKSQTEGSFGGIGIVMSFQEKDKVMVSSVLEESPAQSAGILAGDQIMAVDGVSVTDYQPEETAAHIRGKEGTEVVLTIHREGAEDKDYSITRSNILFKTAAGEMIPEHPNVGYIRIASFSENTAKEFKENYDKLATEGMKGLIIDLRSNPGGLVTSCVDIANMVVPKGDVVSIIDKSGNKEVYVSELEETKYPIVVLIDENSASASEILAGALQDTGAATLVGNKSFGKGSVQIVLPLLAGDAVKMTIAKYYTPSGRSIDGTGIEPDVKVELNAAGGIDNQLVKAIEIMEEKIK
ncbi:MAG: S41 family peptidase [Selenomonadaceae bacterium]|nr:S41 family peptidase [Selenomonadaceae bacterium]